MVRGRVDVHREGAERRERGGQVAVTELEDALGAGDVSQAVQPETSSDDLSRYVRQVRLGGLRAHGLTGVRGGAEPAHRLGTGPL